jgi:hypothetical protein
MKGRFGIPDIVTSGLTFNLDAGNPYSYNPLNTGSTNWTDISGYGNNGVLTNGAFYSGGTMVFDGVNDYSLTTNPSILQSQNLTLSVWIKPNTATNVITGIVDYDHAQGQGWVLQSEDATTNRNYYFAYFDGVTYQPSTGINAGKGIKITNFEWQNLVFVKSGTSITGYFNGSQIYQSTAGSGNISYQPNKNLGIANVISIDGRQYRGSISNVQVYGRPISPFEVYQNFNSLKNRYGFSDIVTEGLILNLDAGNPYSYNPLNTTSTTWTDVSGNGNDGTLTNGVLYSGGTMFLDGTDDYVNCGTGATLTFNNGTNLNDVPFTMGVWVKFNSVLGYQLVIAKSDYGSSPNKREFLFFTNNDSKIHFNLMNLDNYSNRIGRYYNTNLSTNTWYHMFVTYNGSKLESGIKIYINGVRVDDTSDSVGTYSGLSRTTTPFCFGTDWNNYPKQGNKLSGFYGSGMVYRRELSASEILQNYNATKGRYGL